MYIAKKISVPILISVIMGLLLLGFIFNNQMKKNYRTVTATKLFEEIPTVYETCLNMSISLNAEEKFNEALPYALRALEIKPHDINTLQQLGIIYMNLSDFDAANKVLTKSLKLSPNNARLLFNFGYCLGMYQGEMQEAIQTLRKSISLDFTNAKAHQILGELLLMIGEYEQGWQEYAWNVQSERNKPGFMQRVDVKNKTILIQDKAGIGDAMQFARYLKVLKERGAVTIASVRACLKPLYLLCPYIDLVITDKEAVPHYDFVIPFLGLPFTFGTSLKTIPHEVPYLKADPQLVAYWQEKLRSDTNFKIGIAWHSDQIIEKSRPQAARKSIPLKELYPLLRLSDVSFYSLQKFEGSEELKNLPSNIKIHQFGDDFDTSHGAFMDTAAIIENMDLIIAIDTAVAHLAGGLNKPVWLMITFPGEWRWALHRNDSLWYPTMKIFRRKKGGEWKDIVHTMTEELKDLVDQKTL